MVALQRIAHEPCFIHLRRLNALVRWAQKHPLQLKYSKMQCGKILEVHSDAGFRKETKDGGVETGRSQRGANFPRINKPLSPGQTGTCHILDWHCSSLKVVTRSTFASETQAAIAATDSALMLALTLHEIQLGPVNPRSGMHLL